jgi:hypothetical protein
MSEKRSAHIALMQTFNEAALEDRLHNYVKVVLLARDSRLSIH